MPEIANRALPRLGLTRARFEPPCRLVPVCEDDPGSIEIWCGSQWTSGRRRDGLGRCAEAPAFTNGEFAICRFESFQPSHPVWSPRFRRQGSPKSPPIGHYLAIANGLHVPKFDKRPVTWLKVSMDSLNYSRFLESLTRDYFESRMSALASSANERSPRNKNASGRFILA
jgi:hypothetical protein